LLELTTTFRNISTARQSPAEAVRAARAHLRYIDRPSAVEDRASAGFVGEDLAAHRAALRDRFTLRAHTGGKNGARIAEKLIISLPNQWPRHARREALQRLCDHLAPAGSEAVAYGVTHRDKAHNQHLHIVAQDGTEPAAAASARQLERTAKQDGKRTRIRRQNVIRLGDKDRAQAMRAEIAAILNGIAEIHGLERIEHRSFAARGISAEPTEHEGPRVRAITAKTGTDPSGRMAANQRRLERFYNSSALYQSIDDLFPSETSTLRPQPLLVISSKEEQLIPLAAHVPIEPEAVKAQKRAEAVRKAALRFHRERQKQERPKSHPGPGRGRTR
jgi:hypothetical protein